MSHRVTIDPRTDNIPHRVTIEAALPDVTVSPRVDFGGTGQFFNQFVQGGHGEVRVTLNLEGNTTTHEVLVAFAMTGSAKKGTHYSILTPSPIRFAPGQRSAEVVLSIPNPSAYHSPVFTELNIVDSGSFAGLMGQDVYRIDIRSSRTPPTITFDTVSSGAAEPSTASVVGLTLSAASSTPTQVHFEVTGTATLGSDYTLSTASPVVIQSGATTASLTVTPIDDADVESAETVILTLRDDGRTSQANLWTYSHLPHVTEGPGFNAGPWASYPTDNLFKDPNTGPSQWPIVTVVDGVSPDGSEPAYLFGTSEAADGSTKIGKSFLGSARDINNVSAGGSDQFIAVTTNQCLSVYVRKPTTTYFAAARFALEIFERIPATVHRAIFEWSGTAPVVVSTTSAVTAAVMTGQAYDHSSAANNWYRIYVSLASVTGSSLGQGTNRFIYSFFADSTSGTVNENRGKGQVFAWPQYELAATPSAYQRVEGSYWAPRGGATTGGKPVHTVTLTSDD